MDEQIQLKAQEIESSDFEEKVLKSDKPVLVDFWASWCMPCMMMSPVLDQIANEMKDELKVCKINTESAENQILAQSYDIRSIPNMKLFIKGKIVKDYIGFRTKEQFEEELKKDLIELK